MAIAELCICPCSVLCFLGYERPLVVCQSVMPIASVFPPFGFVVWAMIMTLYGCMDLSTALAAEGAFDFRMLTLWKLCVLDNEGYSLVVMHKKD